MGYGGCRTITFFIWLLIHITMRMNALEKLVANSSIYNFIYRHTFLKWFLGFCSLRGRCLEIGCGRGETSKEILRRFGVRLTAIDLDGKQIALARKTLAGEEAELVRADARSLPFKDGRFDCAIEMFTLVHIRDYPKVLEEVSRVLRKGGSFFLMDQSMYLLWPLSRLLPFDHFDGKFTKGTMERELKGAGFEIVKDGWKDIFIIHARKL